MSSPDRSFRGRILAIAMAIAATGLAGCNVRPLYGTAAVGGESTRAALSEVDVQPIEGRVGQSIRNDLLYLMNGGVEGGNTYLLTMTVKEQYASVLTRPISGLPGARNIRITASYTLRRKDAIETPLLSGSVVRIASYDYFTQRFSNDRAVIDAENRAAREIAEDIRTRLASYFVTGKVPTAAAPTADALPNEFEGSIFDEDTGNYGLDY